MGINVGGFYAVVARQVAYIFNIYAAFVQVCGKAMAQAVYAYVLIYTGLLFGIGKHLLYAAGAYGSALPFEQIIFRVYRLCSMSATRQLF